MRVCVNSWMAQRREHRARVTPALYLPRISQYCSVLLFLSSISGSMSMCTPRQSCSWCQDDLHYPHHISLHLSIGYHKISCHLMWWCTMREYGDEQSGQSAVKHSSVQCKVWSTAVVEVEEMVELERTWAGSRKQDKSYMWPWSRFKIHYVSLAKREGAKEQRGLKKEGSMEWWMKEMRIRWNE